MSAPKVSPAPLQVSVDVAGQKVSVPWSMWFNQQNELNNYFLTHGGSGTVAAGSSASWYAQDGEDGQDGMTVPAKQNTDVNLTYDQPTGTLGCKNIALTIGGTIAGNVIPTIGLPMVGAGYLTFGNGTSTLGQDANLTWSATTGLLTKKGISSPTISFLASEAFGLGASAHANSVVVGNGTTDTGGASVVVGQGLTNTGANNVIIGTSITGVGSNNVLLGQGNNGAGTTTSVILGTTNACFAGSSSVNIFGSTNTIGNANATYSNIFGYANTVTPATANGVVGVFGIGLTATHEGCLVLGLQSASQNANELTWGNVGLSGLTNPASFRISGSQSGAESNMTRINCTWSGTNSIVTYSAYLGATEQVGVKIEARTNGAVTTIGSGFLVANLPAGTVGQRAWVTNANAPVWGNTVAGGGAVTVPVFYNGANWIVG